jgi:hypothetical protein
MQTNGAKFPAMGWDWKSLRRTAAYAAWVLPKALWEPVADLWGTPLKALAFIAVLLSGFIVWSALRFEAPVYGWARTR